MPLDGSEFKFEIDETTRALIEVLIEGRRRIDAAWFGGGRRETCVPEHESCAVLAISRQHIGILTLVALAAVSRAAGVRDYSELQPWNDTKGRTKEDVLRVYDAAIAASLSGSAP